MKSKLLKIGLIAALGFLAFIPNASAMTTPIFANAALVPSDTTTQYITAHNVGTTGDVAWSDTEPMGSIFNVAGSFTALCVTVPTAPGSGNSWAITPRINGSDTTTLTLSDAETAECVSMSAAIAAADRVTIKSVPSSTPTTPAEMQISLKFVATTAGQSPWMFDANIENNAGFGGIVQGTSAQTINVMPAPGDISHLRCRAPSALGVGESLVGAIQKNGVDVALALTLNSTTQEAEDTDSVSFVAGDEIRFGAIHFGGSDFVRFGCSLRWTPTTSGEAVVLGFMQLDSYNAVGYIQPQGASVELPDEADNRLLVPYDATWQDMYLDLNNAPGGSDSFKAGARTDGVDGTLTVTVSGASDTGSDTTHTDSLTQGDLINIKKFVTTGGNHTQIKISTVIFLDPGGGGGGAATPNRHVIIIE